MVYVDLIHAFFLYTQWSKKLIIFEQLYLIPLDHTAEAVWSRGRASTSELVGHGFKSGRRQLGHIVAREGLGIPPVLTSYATTLFGDTCKKKNLSVIGRTGPRAELCHHHI